MAQTGLEEEKKKILARSIYFPAQMEREEDVLSSGIQMNICPGLASFSHFKNMAEGSE